MRKFSTQFSKYNEPYLNINHLSNGRCEHISNYRHCWMHSIDTMFIKWNDIVIINGESAFIRDEWHCKTVS